MANPAECSLASAIMIVSRTRAVIIVKGSALGAENAHGVFTLVGIVFESVA